MLKLSDIFCKCIANGYIAVSANPGKPQLYKERELCRLSIEAFNRGDKVFYCDKKLCDGYYRYVESAPRYEYRLKRSLTEDEYEELVELLKNVNI